MKVPHGHVPPPYEADAAERLFAVWKDFAASQNYPGGTDEYVPSYQEAALQRFFPEGGRKVLFLGCGNGREVAAAIRLGNDGYGVTLNNNNVRFAKETLGLQNVYLMDAHILPLAWEGQFDGVMGYQYLEHSPAPVLQLVEVLRVLKPGGVGYFECPGPGETDKDGWSLESSLHHLTAPTAIQAKAWLMKAGFSDPQVEIIGPANAARHLAFWGRKG